MKLSEATFELKQKASQEDLSNAGELLEQIRIEFTRVESFLSRPDWIGAAKQSPKVRTTT